jgi:hypothetical protein
LRVRVVVVRAMEEVSRNRRSAIEIRVRDPSSISLLRAELILSVGLDTDTALILSCSD